MISAIMPCSGWATTGYPYRQALKCWSKVCDEIIIVVHGKREAEDIIQATVDFPNVFVRFIASPPLDSFATYGIYLLIGLFYCHEPDWALSIEADFLISPEQGRILRDTLNSASEEQEIFMADVMTLNYDGTKELYQSEFKKFFCPNDGYVWHRPIGYRPKRGIFPIPFEGTDANNVIVNCEGMISLQSGKYGLSFNSKFMNHNPYGFNLLRTNVRIDHLTFTRFPNALRKKLSHPHWASNEVTARGIVEGNWTLPPDCSYPELEEVTAEYSLMISELMGKS
jgi:hypothetical protein